MALTNPCLDRHLVELVHSGVCLEGVLATRSQVEDILNRKSVNLSSKTIKIVQNIELALRSIYSSAMGVYNSPTTLQSLHSILSNSVEDFTKEIPYRGKFRDFLVEIGGTSYQPPVCSPDVSYRRLDSLLSTVDESIDSILIAYCYLMKYQFFANTNKRTAYTWVNLTLCQLNTGYLLLLPTRIEGMEKFKDYLLSFYESDKELDRFVAYLKRYYLVEAKGYYSSF